MAWDYVPFSLSKKFGGWERSKVVARLKILDDAIFNNVPGVGQVTSASENGKSVTFSTEINGQSAFLAGLEAEKSELLLCLSAIDDNFNTTTNTQFASFRRSC